MLNYLGIGSGNNTGGPTCSHRQTTDNTPETPVLTLSNPGEKQVRSIKMNYVYLLEWQFNPKDFFEQEVQCSILDAEVTFNYGKIEAHVPPNVFESEADFDAAIHEQVSRMFSGVQLVAKRKFKLTEPAITRLYPDGRRGIYVKAKTGICFLVGYPVDIVITRADGTRIDSKAERIESKRELANRVAEYGTDPHLSTMLASFKRAMEDRENTLIHLYEVLDTLSERFGGKKHAMDALSIPNDLWSDLGRLANHEPVKEGRHRGKMVLNLRAATNVELDHCKSIAANLISRYVDFLASNDGA